MQTYKNRIPMRNWAEEDLPGQKMLLKGVNSLSDSELLAIIIGTGIKDNSSLEIAKQMLGNSNINLNAFWRTDYSDLKKFTGIGEKRAIKLLAIFALARRRNESETMSQPKVNEQTRLESDMSRITAVRPHRSESTPPPMLPAMLKR